MLCVRCGARLLGTEKFCPECGSAVSSISTNARHVSRPLLVFAAVGFALVVLAMILNNPGTSSSIPDTAQPSRIPHPKLLTKEEQDTQWREHLAKYGPQVFSQIKIWRVDDHRPGLQFIQLHTCATEVATGNSHYYVFGINFAFHHELYEGAPLQEVLYGPYGWPNSEQVLGPVFNISPQEQADEEESRKSREQYLARNPPTERHYMKDPCNGQELLE